MSNITVKGNARDSLRDLPNVFMRAADDGMNVPAYLERIDPSNEYDDKSDAFTRICREAAVVTKGNPAAGLHATQMSTLLNGTHKDAQGEELGKERGRALAMIWIERRWREAKYNKSASTRQMFTSDEEVVGSAFRPWADNLDPRVVGLTPQIPVSELVALETPINGTAYRTVYLDQPDREDLEYERVSEGAEIPRAHLRLRDQTVNLHKYGRAIDWTYEVARNTRLDKLRLLIQQMALASEAGKVAAIVQTLIEGDGNPGTAATVVPITDLDATATGGPITLRAYLAAKKLFRAPFALTTILGDAAAISDLEMVPVGSDERPLITVGNGSGIGSIVPINGSPVANSVRYAHTEGDEIAEDNYLLFDRNAAVERVYEVGATVSEADRFITSQVEVMTFTEVEGFAKMNAESAYLLDMTE